VNYLKAGDVAAELRVSEQAVRVWCRKGILPAIRPQGTRQWLIDPQEYRAWLHRAPVQHVVESLQADYRDDRPDHEIAEEFYRDREMEDEARAAEG
jgi:hypothetical protein